MKKVAVADAVGLPLGHDITEIIPDRKIKRRAFQRGHIITAADVERLRDLGKSAVFIVTEDDTAVHEDDAALTAAPLLAGENIVCDPAPCEGKISFRAACDGLFRVDPERLYQVNALAIPALPTIPDRFPVQAGHTVAAFRIIPLTCSREIMDRLVAILDTPLLSVTPYSLRTAAILVTGDEVYTGRIKDGFVPRLTTTLAKYGVTVAESQILPDDKARISAAVIGAAERCDIVLVTGGTSVDPDDVTVAAMTAAGVVYEVQGIPVQPGNNFTIGYREGTPVCAVPAATLFYEATALDVCLPRLLAGERLTREQIFRLGHGGLAQPGAEKHFPDCTFGWGG